MINPAAVTLFVGILTFVKLLFYSSFARRSLGEGGVHTFVFWQFACKGIRKMQLQRTNKENFSYIRYRRG
jgi:hypothetical protein